MTREDISVLVLCDREGMRSANIRYLTGHPSDAVLFIFRNKKSILLPWDMDLAEKKSSGVILKPYTAYNRDFAGAIMAILHEMNIPAGSKVEIPSGLPYPEAVSFIKDAGYEFLCRENGLETEIDRMRQIKDVHEIEILRRSVEITDSILDMIESSVRNGSVTETDIAFLIERECRRAGAEGTGFETLVAGPERSCNIHAFPAYTGTVFSGDGLSIVDFGIKLDGYTSDVTLTVVKNPTAEQSRMTELAEQAVHIAEGMLKPGSRTVDISMAVSSFFQRAGYEMPHALGHGIGLEIHENPVLRTREPSVELRPGMILAVEPGIYSPGSGGVRLENDYLITDSGFEKLTNSRIIRL